MYIASVCGMSLCTILSLSLPLSFYDELPKDKNNIFLSLNIQWFLVRLVLHQKMAMITNEENKRNKYWISKDTDCSKLYIEQTVVSVWVVFFYPFLETMTSWLKICHHVWVFFLEYKQAMLFFFAKTRSIRERGMGSHRSDIYSDQWSHHCPRMKGEREYLVVVFLLSVLVELFMEILPTQHP